MVSNKYRAGITHICIVLVILLLAYVFFGNKGENTRIRKPEINDGGLVWTCEGNTVNFPVSMEVERNVPVVFSAILPENLPVDAALEFLSVYAKCEVYVDGRCINSYAAGTSQFFNRMSGNIRIITPIDSSAANKEVRVIFTPYYDVHADFAGISFANEDAIKYRILADNIVRLIIIASLLTIVLVGIVLAGYQRFSGNRSNYSLFANFSAFSLIVMMWIFLSSDIPQFITDNNTAMAMGSFFCISMIGIPYLGFAAQIYVKGREVSRMLQLAGWALPLLNVIGYVFGIYDPIEILLLSHLYIAAAAITSFVLSLINIHVNYESRVMLAASLVFIIGMGGGIAYFNIAPSQGNAGNYVGISMVAFIVILFSLVLFRQIAYIRERKYQDTYNELTYKDILTGLGNRAAYEKFLSDVCEKEAAGTDISLFLFSMNQLKKVNDEEGHVVGDKMLVGISECLSRTFKLYGHSFRLGGDEFAVVTVGQKKSADRLLREFDANLDYFNKFGKTDASVARGWCQMPLEKRHSFVQDIYRFADQAMYADKQRMNQRQ